MLTKSILEKELSDLVANKKQAKDLQDLRDTNGEPLAIIADFSECFKIARNMGMRSEWASHITAVMCSTETGDYTNVWFCESNTPYDIHSFWYSPAFYGLKG